MKIRNPRLYRLMKNFLTVYLPDTKQKSPHTVQAYRDALNLYMGFLDSAKSVKLKDVCISDFNQENIPAFLRWLHDERGNESTTVNQRLSHIKGFCRYVQKKDVLSFETYSEICGVTGYKDDRVKDFIWLAIELADLCVGSIRLDAPAQVKLFGKGRKSRSVPLMDKTASLLKQYLSEHGLDSPAHYEHPLFFNSQGKKLTRQGIAYILKKYAAECGITEISPHKIRHTKAMHLTEADINPIFIRDFLGHTDLKVTEVYSKTSVKMKKAALDKMKFGKDVVPDKPKADWTEDKSLLDWLNELKQ